MGKRNTKAKRSLGSMPRGLVRRNKGNDSKNDPGNPFEMTFRQKRPKHLVHNRPVSKPKTTKHALESMQQRQSQLRSNLRDSKKANQFVDRRIGQYDPDMSRDDQMLARLVKERTRQSSRSSKFRLDDGGGDNGFGMNGRNDSLSFLTHKGQKLNPQKSEALYSDDEDDDKGNLDAIDTELHFGGSGLSSTGASNPYGNSTIANTDLSQLYGQTRKNELDDLIARRKAMKAVKMEAKETQLDTFEKMDETFGELSHLLRYRKNEQKPLIPLKPTKEDKEMNDWNSEIRQMMMKPKRRATDRTKTSEEIAKEELERLHELETRRMARMNGDFEEDDLSDISLHTTKKNKKSKQRNRNPDELSDSDVDNNDEVDPQPKFTQDGLKYFDKNGNVLQSDESDSDSGEESDSSYQPLLDGSRVRGNYRAVEQFSGRENWYDGKIIKVNTSDNGSMTYDVEYDDGDIEKNMIPKNVRAVEKVVVQDTTNKNKEDDLQLKRKLAKQKARYVAHY